MTDGIKRYEQGGAALIVNRDRCKGCDICVNACPPHILALDEMDKIVVNDINQCIFCGICAERCPDFCFILEPEIKDIGIKD